MPRLDYREQFICLISASLLPIFEVSFSIYEYIIMVSRFALTLGAILFVFVHIWLELLNVLRHFWHKVSQLPSHRTQIR